MELRRQGVIGTPLTQHPCDMEVIGCSRDVQCPIELELRANQSRHVLETNSGTLISKTHDAALDAFIAAKIEIDAMLARLVAHSADHFGYRPEEVNWGHVCTLAHYRARLREITDMAFREREHAEEV